MKSLVLYLDSSQLFTFFLRNESVEGYTEVGDKSPETEAKLCRRKFLVSGPKGRVLSREVLSDTETKQEIQLSNIPRSFRFDETKQTRKRC